jgi:hypothetical protein
MPPRKQLISGEEAVPSKRQIRKPCSDCPFGRIALKGWLGSMPLPDWIRAIQGESRIDCHTLIGPQCAGAAIFRANICKKPRDKSLLVLPPDDSLVFSSVEEFTKHHGKKDLIHCNDCNGDYVPGAPHYMFCAAKMCTDCGCTFSYNIPIYDSRTVDEDGEPAPRRLCHECLEHALDEDEEE